VAGLSGIHPEGQSAQRLKVVSNEAHKAAWTFGNAGLLLKAVYGEAHRIARKGHVLHRKFHVLDRKKGGSGVGLIVKKGSWREFDRKSPWRESRRVTTSL
jgi:hypothetical protein